MDLSADSLSPVGHYSLATAVQITTEWIDLDYCNARLGLRGVSRESSSMPRKIRWRCSVQSVAVSPEGLFPSPSFLVALQMGFIPCCTRFETGGIIMPLKLPSHGFDSSLRESLLCRRHSTEGIGRGNPDLHDGDLSLAIVCRLAFRPRGGRKLGRRKIAFPGAPVVGFAMEGSSKHGAFGGGRNDGSGDRDWAQREPWETLVEKRPVCKTPGCS